MRRYLIATGLAAFAFVALTVGRHPDAELMHSDGPTHEHAAIMRWVHHGVFASYGLMFPFDDETIAYRSWSGVFLVSGFLVERLAIAVTGNYCWRCLALHNIFVAGVLATLLALLAYRIAEKLGSPPLHAFVVAVATQMVAFTFPGNVASYWYLAQPAVAMVAALAFLLFDERPIAQAVCAFFATYAEHVYGTMFLAAYVIVTLLTGDKRPSLKLLAIPWLLAVALFAVQRQAATYDPALHVAGSKFIYRSGLDGDTTLYHDHLDIALGRDVIRANFPAHPELLFRWPSLFFGGIAALAAIIAAAIRKRLPPFALVTVVSLAGAYVLYAALFSQVVAVHPYVYDVVLALPLTLALFGVAPALIESLTQRSGVALVVTLFAAAWLSLYQLRLTALTHPLAQ